MKTMKTNIKSNKFYTEAESMQKGYGRYLKSIDKLKDAVERQDCISLKDACWILYGEGMTSGVRLTKNGIVFRHYHGKSSVVCEASGKPWK